MKQHAPYFTIFEIISFFTLVLFANCLDAQLVFDRNGQILTNPNATSTITYTNTTQIIQPEGLGYVMQGGSQSLISNLPPTLNSNMLMTNGKTLGEMVDAVMASLQQDPGFHNGNLTNGASFQDDIAAALARGDWHMNSQGQYVVLLPQGTPYYPGQLAQQFVWSVLGVAQAPTINPGTNNSPAINFVSINTDQYGNKWGNEANGNRVLITEGPLNNGGDPNYSTNGNPYGNTYEQKNSYYFNADGTPKPNSPMGQEIRNQLAAGIRNGTATTAGTPSSPYSAALTFFWQQGSQAQQEMPTLSNMWQSDLNNYAIYHGPVTVTPPASNEVLIGGAASEGAAPRTVSVLGVSGVMDNGVFIPSDN
jgi:hypothetical protein